MKLEGTPALVPLAVYWLLGTAPQSCCAAAAAKQRILPGAARNSGGTPKARLPSHLRGLGGRRGAALTQQRAHTSGVRDGAGPAEWDQDPDGFGDGALNVNAWRGGSQAYDFPFLDNLEPVAPMDGVSPPGSTTVLGPEPMPGEHHNSIYLPPYRNPDLFPSIAGPHCMCETPPLAKTTPEQEAWAVKVAKQLGIRLSEMPKPLSPKGATTCMCTTGVDAEGDENPATFRWVNVKPVLNSRNFTLDPADITYPAGDYWHPKLKSGLVAPEDRMPMEYYPVQATADWIRYVPATAKEDRIASRFARYVDQLHSRDLACDGDAVSEACTTECRPGDEVTAQIGSTYFKAKMVTTHRGGSVVIEFAPAHRRPSDPGVACPVEASCSIFRICLRPRAWCVERESENSRDYLGNLVRKLRCPEGTQECGSVQQVMGARFLKKGDKTCRAKAAFDHSLV